MSSQILLLAPLSLGKKIKTALERGGILDKGGKITRWGWDTGDGKVAGDTTEKKDDALGAAGEGITRMKVAEEGKGNGERLRIPTTIRVNSPSVQAKPDDCYEEEHQLMKRALLEQVGMMDHADQITLILRPCRTPISSIITTAAAAATTKIRTPSPNQDFLGSISSSPSLLARVIEKWALSLPPTPVPTTHFLKTDACSYSYTIYPPMLLLPVRTFGFVASLAAGGDGGGEGWRGKEGMMIRKNEEVMQDLYGTLCEAFKVTHIALSGPIPAMMLEDQGRLDSSSPFTSSCILKNANPEKEGNAPSPSLIPKTQKSPNILRSPLNTFTPLHNDFGPSLPAHHVPTRDDFAKAFWCTVQQNGIFQTWAPRYTMFSRGNVSEKTRLLRLLSSPSKTTRMMKNHTKESGLTGSVGRVEMNEEKGPSEGESRERERISAVDLYAGVGYFAFCYAARKEVVDKVFCWEISRWSVEGLRRGAVCNGWGVRVFEDGEQNDDENGDESKGKDEDRLVVFQENNQQAAARIEAMRNRIPPVRQVNCGFLPSSRDSWETAVQVLDPIQGGWIHAHENIAIGAFERRRMDIVKVFRDLVERHHHHGRQDEDERLQWQVECVHFEQVKTYAPGIYHCVLDILISRFPPIDTAPQTNVSTPSVQK